MKPIVYLAGPITGLSWSQATSWREEAKRRLAPAIECASPMRGFDHLRDETQLKHTYVGHPFTKQRGIMQRDYFDVCRSTALLVNFLGAKKLSIGTPMELAWTYHLRKPVVVVMEEDGTNPYDHHPMLLEAVDFRTASLDAGIDLIRTIVSAE